nr:restriction endonuclease subunit S [Streptococcus pseudopneumoniae]
MFGDFYTTLFPKYKIGEKFEVSSGSTPSRDNKLYWDSGTINWVKTTEVINREITETEEKITKFALENTSLKLFPVDTILIAMYGQGQTRGRSAILKVESTSNQACGAIFPNKIDNPVFIWHQLMLRYSELRELGRGGNQPNLNGQLIKNFELIFPPLALQNEFADFVAQVDKSQFNEMFGDVILNEKEWKVSKWNEILTIRNGKNQKQVEDADGKFPIYGSGGIMGYAKDWIVKKNSVIIGRKGNINKPILVRENFWNVDTAFGLEPVLEKINSEYLFYFCQLYNFEKLNKAVTIPSLTKSDLLNISIPLPPLALQNEFADFVVQVDKSQFACEIAIKVWRNSLKFSII